MSRSTFFTLFIYFLYVSFDVSVAKVIPSSQWASDASKPVYSRSLGPPSTDMGTITVPYLPKSPFFPKFVDPTSMISKKTEILSNLFGAGGISKTVGDSKATSVPLGYNTASKVEFTAPKLDYTPAKVDYTPLKVDYTASTVDYDKILAPWGKRAARDLESEAELKPQETSETLSDSDSKLGTRSTASDEQPSNGTPKEYLPGMMAPFAFDPSMFIAKKSEFLDTLFKNIGTSTTVSTTTEFSSPSSTIVPPGFWIPSSTVTSPNEYTERVAAFLNTLFENLKNNLTANAQSEEAMPNFEDFESAVVTQKRTTRATDDVESLDTIRDTISSAILDELTNVKDDISSIANDAMEYQRTLPPPVAPKKPSKSMGPAAMTAQMNDPLMPFKQKIDFLNHIFDMLADLQRNITSNIQEIIAAKARLIPSTDATYDDLLRVPLTLTNPAGPFNQDFLADYTIFNALHKKMLSALGAYAANTATSTSVKTTRSSPSPTSFWVAYPDNAPSSHTLFKRRVNTSGNDDSKDYGSSSNQFYEAPDKMKDAQRYQQSALWEPEQEKNFREWMQWMQHEHYRHHHH